MKVESEDKGVTTYSEGKLEEVVVEDAVGLGIEVEVEVEVGIGSGRLRGR